MHYSNFTLPLDLNAAMIFGSANVLSVSALRVLVRLLFPAGDAAGKAGGAAHTGRYGFRVLFELLTGFRCVDVRAGDILLGLLAADAGGGCHAQQLFLVQAVPAIQQLAGGSGGCQQDANMQVIKLFLGVVG